MYLSALGVCVCGILLHTHVRTHAPVVRAREQPMYTMLLFAAQMRSQSCMCVYACVVGVHMRVMHSLLHLPTLTLNGKYVSSFWSPEHKAVELCCSPCAMQLMVPPPCFLVQFCVHVWPVLIACCVYEGFMLFRRALLEMEGGQR
jgi:hypothetical protein